MSITSSPLPEYRHRTRTVQLANCDGTGGPPKKEVDQRVTFALQPDGKTYRLASISDISDVRPIARADSAL